MDQEVPEELVQLVTGLLGAPPVQWNVTRVDLYVLYRTVRLALRHKAFPANVRGRVEALAGQMEEALGLTPELRALLAAGWDTIEDVPLA